MSYDSALDGHILNIVQNQEIHEQMDLQTSLQERGFDIPQATLSRRLKKLKIAKVAGIYKVVELHMPNLPQILNVKISEFGLIVLHTHPGNASSLAYYIDQRWVSYQPQTSQSSGILGTIAGDDTVILIVEKKDKIKQVLDLLHADFPYLHFS
jgi:transcriptional regulator of arginine metabolism